MADSERIAVVGGSGMLGRPVVRRLLSEGFRVRCVSRSADRARRLLPSKVECVGVDIRDAAALREGLRGCHGVHINLATPFSDRVFDPDYEGTPLVLAACKEASVTRLTRTSAMGVGLVASDWFALRRKLETDERVLASGLAATIFRPTWFMESLVLFRTGPLMVLPPHPSAGLYWLAGDDLGRCVAAAMRKPETAGRAYVLQGPEQVPLREAAQRLARAAGWRAAIVTLPSAGLAVAARFSPMAAYLSDLLEVTWQAETVNRAADARLDLSEPSMRLEHYAGYLLRTGDRPRK